MIRFNQKAHKLAEAMNITPKELKEVTTMWDFLDTQFKGTTNPIAWAIQRVNIDEHLNEAQKYFLIFALGRMYQDNERRNQ